MGIAYAYKNNQDRQGPYETNEVIFDRIPTPIAIIDKSCRVIFANSSFCATIPVRIRKGPAYSICSACTKGPCSLAFSLKNVIAGNAPDKQIVRYDADIGGNAVLALSISPIEHLQAHVLTFENIAGTLEAEERQPLIVTELNHRVNSALQVAKSLATQTARHSDSLESFLSAFEGRILAFAQAQSTSYRQFGALAGLQMIVEQSIENHELDKQRIRITPGPAVEIPPEEALSLQLVIHELVTNALSYGALSSKNGTVELSWKVSVDSETRVHILWREAGGPHVAQPKKKGFGSKLIELLLPFDLNGRAALRFESAGLQCELEFPVPKEGRVIFA